MASSFESLEDAARSVINILQTFPEFADAKIGIIGGMALWNHLQTYRTTDDVDFVINVKGAPKSVKEKLVKLPNFESKADVFFFKPSGGGQVQIDICSDQMLPFIPNTAKTLSTIKPEEPLPYVEADDLLVFKIYSCGLRGDKAKKTRDANDASVLLAFLTEEDKLLQLNDEQQLYVKEGLDAVVGVLEEEAEVWKGKLGI